MAKNTDSVHIRLLKVKKKKITVGTEKNSKIGSGRRWTALFGAKQRKTLTHRAEMYLFYTI